MFGIIMGFNAGKQIKVDDYLTTVKDVTPVSELCQSLLPEEQEEIYSYSGKIIELNDNSVTIEVQVIESMNLIKKDVIINIDNNTKINKIDISTPPMPDEDILEEEISFSDLNVDDEILVKAEENIKHKNKFTASTVTLIIN
ncbi:MAG: hypothetical protein ABID45_04170 [Patescibacteria group bacterium]